MPLPQGYIHVLNHIKNCIKSDFKDICLKLATNEWSDKTFLLTSKLCPLGAVCPCPGAMCMYKIMTKNLYKIRLQRDCLKLATNDRSDKMFLLTLKFRPQGDVKPCRGVIYMYKIMKKMYKIRLQRYFFKLVANEQSDKRFLLTSKFCPLGLSAPGLGLYTCIKYGKKNGIKSDFKEPFF